MHFGPLQMTNRLGWAGTAENAGSLAGPFAVVPTDRPTGQCRLCLLYQLQLPREGEPCMEGASHGSRVTRAESLPRWLVISEEVRVRAAPATTRTAAGEGPRGIELQIYN